MKISIFCLCVNLAFAFLFLRSLSGTPVKGEAGLAVANTLSACFNVVLLVYGLRRKLSRLGLTSCVRTLLVLVPNAILAGVVAATLGWLWETRFGHGRLALRVGAVFVPAAVACLLYWVVALWLRVPAAHDVSNLLLRRFRRAR